MKKNYLKALILIVVCQMTEIACQTGCELNNQIYSVQQQRCLQCPQGCLKCYSMDPQSCYLCAQGYYRDPLTLTCEINCSQGYYQEEQLRICKQCLVKGCKQCSGSYICEECLSNFYLNEESICVVNSHNQNQEQFYLQETNQFYYSCPNGYSEDKEMKACQKILKCPIIQESKDKVINEKINNISVLSNKYLVVQGDYCLFQLFDEKFNFVAKFELIKSSEFGTTIQQRNSIAGDIVVCISNLQIVKYNFVTEKIEFQRQGNYQSSQIFSYYPEDDSVILFYFSSGYQWIRFSSNEEISLNYVKTGQLKPVYSFFSKSKRIFIFQELVNQSISLNIQIFKIIFNYKDPYKLFTYGLETFVRYFFGVRHIFVLITENPHIFSNTPLLKIQTKIKIQKALKKQGQMLVNQLFFQSNIYFLLQKTFYQRNLLS